jgi:hypothetical protein
MYYSNLYQVYDTNMRTSVVFFGASPNSFKRLGLYFLSVSRVYADLTPASLLLLYVWCSVEGDQKGHNGVA